jgi:AbrB family looped-hinge helix DNA binding protein
MRTTIDKAGRVVIPKALRDEIGLTPGDVEVVRDGSALRIEPLTGSGLEERGGRLVIPAADAPIDDEAVRRMRDADRR